MMLNRIANYEREMAALRAETAVRLNGYFRRYLLYAPSAEPTADRAFRELLARVGADARVLEHKQRGADRYRVEIHKKFSIPAACLAFILVGAPLGARVRRSSPAVGAGVSIGFFLIYWLFLIGGEKLADRGFVAPWFAMWSPNILVALAGVWMSVRMIFEQGVWPKVRVRCAS